MDNRDEVIRHLLYRMKKYEKVMTAIVDIKKDGMAGTGRNVDGHQTVQIRTQKWAELMDVVDDAADVPGTI